MKLYHRFGLCRFDEVGTPLHQHWHVMELSVPFFTRLLIGQICSDPHAAKENTEERDLRTIAYILSLLSPQVYVAVVCNLPTMIAIATNYSLCPFKINRKL